MFDKTEPAIRFTAVVPSDTEGAGDFSKRQEEWPRAIYVGVAGDVCLVSTAGITPVIFKNCPAGLIIPAICRRVNATGTTATNLVALY